MANADVVAKLRKRMRISGCWALCIISACLAAIGMDSHPRFLVIHVALWVGAGLLMLGTSGLLMSLRDRVSNSLTWLGVTGRRVKWAASGSVLLAYLVFAQRPVARGVDLAGTPRAGAWGRISSLCPGD